MKKLNLKLSKNEITFNEEYETDSEGNIWCSKKNIGIKFTTMSHLGFAKVLVNDKGETTMFRCADGFIRHIRIIEKRPWSDGSYTCLAVVEKNHDKN